MQKQEQTERLRQFEETCRAKGMPLTVQRRVILEAVLDTDEHPTADQILELVKGRLPGLSRTTVYRVLDALAEVGVIRRVRQTGTAARYDGNLHRHHHLVCSQCGKMVDFERSDADELPLPEGKPHGFDIDDYAVQYFGTCGQCRKELSK